jgi:hypothetical protein
MDARDPLCRPTDYFDSDQAFAIDLDVVGFYSVSPESALQHLQRHSPHPAELALRQAISSKLAYKPIESPGECAASVDELLRVPTSATSAKPRRNRSWGW